MIRPDTLTIFFIFLSLLVFMHEKYFLSAVILMIGFETHAMGAVGIFYILAYVIYKKDFFLSNKRKLIKSVSIFFAGIIIGLFYFILLHYDVLKFYDLNVFLSKRKMNHPAMIYLFTYFAQSYWYRHVWEFILICFSLYFFFKHKVYKENKFVLILFLILLLSVFITRRQNKNYMLYFYPSFLLIYFTTFDKLGKIKEFTIFLIITFIIYFGAHYAVNRNYNFQKILTNTTHHLTDKSVPVIGMPDNWFGAMDRTFYPIYPSYIYIPGYNLKQFYLIRNDYVSHRSNNYYNFMTYVSTNYNQQLITKFNAYDNNDVEIYLCTRKGKKR